MLPSFNTLNDQMKDAVYKAKKVSKFRRVLILFGLVKAASLDNVIHKIEMS